MSSRDHLASGGGAIRSPAPGPGVCTNTSVTSTATASVEGPWARITLEGLRPVPREALRRLHDLCQTAAEL